MKLRLTAPLAFLVLLMLFPPLSGAMKAQVPAGYGPGDGALDSDGDGRPDAEDRCPGAAAPNHRGCPLFDRRISIHRHGDTFTGKVRSDERRCVKGAIARIDRLHDGRHEVVGLDRHLDHGGYSIDVPARRGRYSATVGRDVLRRTGICPFAASRTIVIRGSRSG